MPKDTASTLRIATWNDVLKWSWTAERLLRELLHIDYSTTPRLTDLTAGTIPQWGSVFAHHPDTWRLLIDGDRSIVGYWSFHILSDEIHDRARRGDLQESEITLDKVKLEIAGHHRAYLAMIAIKEPYRGVRSLRILFDAFVGCLQDLSVNGVYITEFVATACSNAGIALCESFGMKPVATNKVAGVVYAAPIQSILGHPMARDSADLTIQYHREGLLKLSSPAERHHSWRSLAHSEDRHQHAASPGQD